MLNEYCDQATGCYTERSWFYLQQGHIIHIGHEAFRTYYSVGREIERQKCVKEKQQRSKTNKKRHCHVTPTAVNLRAVYRTAVPLYGVNKRVILYENTSNVVRILCVGHTWCTVNIEFCNVLYLSCTCPCNTDKQYK